VTHFAKRLGHEKAVQDKLLCLFALLTRFPPAVRSLYSLLMQIKPTDADRAALVQSVFELAIDFLPAEMVNGDRRCLFEASRLLFGYFYQICYSDQDSESVAFPQEEETVYYLDSFQYVSLQSPATLETVVDPVYLPSIGKVMERSLAAEYTTGALRMTNPRFIDLLIDEDSSAVTGNLRRICVSFGGRMSGVTFSDPECNPTTPAGNYGLHNVEQAWTNPDMRQLSETISKGPLAVIAPMELKAGIEPVLTVDSDGLLAVFVGMARCTAPPVK